MARWIKMPLGRKVGLDRSDIVLDGDPAPPKKGAQPPKFSAYVCCDQTAGWIKMPLGTMVGLGAPIFGPCLLWPNGRPSQLLLSTCYIHF